MSHADPIIFTYVFFTPRLFVWVKYGFWSLDFFISVLLSLLPPILDARLAAHKIRSPSTCPRLVLRASPWILRCQETLPMACDVKRLPHLPYYFMMLFFPYIGIFTRFGFWSLLFGTDSMLWYLANFPCYIFIMIISHLASWGSFRACFMHTISLCNIQVGSRISIETFRLRP